MFNFRKKKEISIDSLEKGGSSIFSDIDTCLSSGYPEDAVNLIEDALKKVSKHQDKLKLYLKLEQVYVSTDKPDMKIQTYKRLSEFILTEAPHLKFEVIPQSLELYKQGDYTPEPEEIKPLAELACEKKDYSTALKLISGFVKKHAGHADYDDNYLIAAKCFAAQKAYAKAVKIYRNILSKLEATDSRYLDVKSALLLVNQKAKKQRQP
ncbi:MAG: hypothetical protein CR975_05710 [Gammaproteobacteria bacterium]|nr:MAG: hypothetical protein CR975_05710 [Gammaproteobacteria bacterium]